MGLRIESDGSGGLNVVAETSIQRTDTVVEEIETRIRDETKDIKETSTIWKKLEERIFWIVFGLISLAVLIYFKKKLINL